MRHFLIALFVLLLITSLPSSVNAAGRPSEQPIVHIVLVWSNGCPYCTEVLTDILPPLQDKYNSQLSILLVELVSLKDVDNLYALGSALGRSKEQVSVPFLLIGQTALIGVDEIQNQLSGLIDEYISAGGLET
jgi:glutaredoxin